jgi:hypothetical protein
MVIGCSFISVIGGYNGYWYLFYLLLLTFLVVILLIIISDYSINGH